MSYTREDSPETRELERAALQFAKDFEAISKERPAIQREKFQSKLQECQTKIQELRREQLRREQLQELLRKEPAEGSVDV